MISLLVNSKKDSQFISKFILSFMTNTVNFDNVELLILTPPGGTWNKELYEYFGDKIRVFDDNTGLGRGGNHVYYEILSKEAKGDWMWLLCDDHYLYPGYDEYISNYIKEEELDPKDIHVIAPAVDNSGRISHILSRKYVKTVEISPQGNVDSCINETLEMLDLMKVNNVLHLPPHNIMHDFSMDKNLFPKTPFDEGHEIELFKSQPIKDKILSNAKKLANSI